MKHAETRGVASVVPLKSQRGIQCDQGWLPYELELKRRKTIGIYIRAGQVLVRAPHRTNISKVEAFLLEKSDWIYQKRQEQENKQSQKMQMVWEDGSTVHYLGRSLTLRLNPAVNSIVLHETGALEVGLWASNKSKKVRAVSELVEAWMKKEALKRFKEKCSIFEAVLGVRAHKILLTSAKTRWGSANARKEIRLHWRLVQMPDDVIDYVVVHELAHLKEMNHSNRFWNIVQSVLPDYSQRRMRLKKMTLPDWHCSKAHLE